MDVQEVTNNFYSIVNPASKQDFFSKYIVLLSPLIVILTFLFNNWYNVRSKKKETKRAWYFKAYFEPHLKKLEDFFFNSDIEIRDALNKYNREAPSWNKNQRVEFISQTLLTRADAKRKFTIEVLDILQPEYPKEFSNLENILLSYDDAVSDAFLEITHEEDEFNSDFRPIYEDAYFQYIAKINKIKADLIRTLSGPALS